MISSIVVTGYLKGIKNERFRILHNVFEDAFYPYTEKVSLIPVLNWSRDSENLLMRLPENTFVIIRGHLEEDSELGIYVLVETLQLTKPISS